MIKGMALGGVSTPTVIDCTRCGRKVVIPAGLILRIPKEEVYWCHETVDPVSGKVHRRGDPM